MSRRPRRVLVLGGGISALTAGIELLERGIADKVTLACMEHHLGGKAASWRYADGRLMEIGFHAIFGYYHAIRALLERVGRPTTSSRWFTSNEGEHLMYEPAARALNRIRVPRGPFDAPALLHAVTERYQGMGAGEKLAFAQFAGRLGLYFARHPPESIDPALDEYSFTEFCVSHGLPLGLTEKAWFRYVLDLAFNYPAPGSAYVGAYGFRKLMGYDASEVFYLNGGLSEVIIDPLAAHFRRLGGVVELGSKVVRMEFDPVGRVVTQVELASMGRVEPRSALHVVAEEPEGVPPRLDVPSSNEGDPAPGPGDTRILRLGADFDLVVSTLPVDSTRAVLRASAGFDTTVLAHRFFRDMWRLRTVASISMRVWSPEKLLPPDFTTVVMGTPQPAATIIDYANRIDELRAGPWKSVLEFEGQEGLHGGFRNAELKRMILEQFADLPFARFRREWLTDALGNRNGWHTELRRNAPHHLRYLLMEPGHWKFRPDAAECPYENLVLAGDWLKSAQPTASMEAAVQTGQRAAELIAARA